MMPHGIDTSPVIVAYDMAYRSGNPAKMPPQPYSGRCITGIYRYTPDAHNKQTVVTMQAYGYAVVYNQDAYVDYWNLYSIVNEERRNVINIGSDGMAFTLLTENLSGSYAYILETGEILFAGKNTPYYGHRNISELN